MKMASLRSLYESANKDYELQRRQGKLDAVNKFEAELEEAFRTKQVKPDEFSIRDVFESLVPDGRQMIDEWRRGASKGGLRVLQESAGGVSMKGFTYVTSQMLYTTVKERWDSPEFIGDRLVTTMPSSLLQETIPVVSGTEDVAETLDEFQEYPMATIGDAAVRTPVTRRRGVQIALTRDIIMFDRTGEVLRRASKISEDFRANKEKRILDVVCGIVNPYNYNETYYDTYQSSTPWINLKTSNGLADFSDIQNAEDLLMQMTDPFTGEPIMVTAKEMLVPHTLNHQAKQIISATEIRTGTDSGNRQTYASNTLKNYDILTNPYVKSRTSSTTTWFIGDFKKAFAYVENTPITLEERPVGDDGWSKDIVAGWKVYERGAAAVIEPRYVVKNTA